MTKRQFLAAAVLALASFTGPSARADVFTNVPEAAAYTEVYRLTLPQFNAAYNTNAIPYSVNNSATTPATFTRVAYYLELQGTAGGSTLQWVYVSFDKPSIFTAANKIGIPSNGSNGSAIVSNTTVANMNVASNVGTITTGTGLSGGKIEFWPSSYSTGTDGAYNHDDTGFGSSSGHASMQVHNTSVPQTLFGYSDWGGSNFGTGTNPAEIGIGNRATSHPDWTLSDNGTTYAVRNMQILVLPVPEPAGLTAAALAAGAALLRRRRPFAQ